MTMAPWGSDLERQLELVGATPLPAPAPAGPEPDVEPYLIRPMEPGDRHFVLDSWLNSRLENVKRKRWNHEQRHAWFASHRPRTIEILDSCHVLVACDRDAPTSILGWMAHDGRQALYAYTKHLFRGYGVSRALARAAGLPEP